MLKTHQCPISSSARLLDESLSSYILSAMTNDQFFVCLDHPHNVLNTELNVRINEQKVSCIRQVHKWWAIVLRPRRTGIAQERW